MTQDEIIEMAKQVGEDWWADDLDLEAFASLVAQHAKAEEREECAKVCEEYETENDITATWLNLVAEAIRARGQA